jgi:zinc protease
VKSGPIADWEIEKARNSARRNAATTVISTLQRAIQLGQYALFYDDPNRINTISERIEKVTAADVQRVAKQYLTKENRSVIITTAKPTAATKGGQQ